MIRRIVMLALALFAVVLGIAVLVSGEIEQTHPLAWLRLGALPHDTLLTAYTRAHGREDLYVRDFTYTRGAVQDFGRYSHTHGWSGNVEGQSVLVCPLGRVDAEWLDVRFIHDTRQEGDCDLPGNY